MYPYTIGAALIAAVGIIIYEIIQGNRQRNEYRYEAPPRSSSLRCCLCGEYISPVARKLRCGHVCHKRCYDQLSSESLTCGFCGYDMSDDVPPSRESENVRRRTTASVVSPTASAASPTDTTSPCGYCEIPVENPTTVDKMSCGHYAHSDCRKSYNGLLMCAICALEGLWDPV